MAGGIQNYIDCIVPQVGLAVIVDTGSSDNTVSILRRNAECYPHLHIFETPFETFATTRNQSMDFAISLAPKYPAITHLLLLDADERICGDQMLFFAQVSQKIVASHVQRNDPLNIDSNGMSSVFHSSCVKFKALNVDADGSPSSRKNAGLMNPRLFPFDRRFRFRDMVQEKRFERLMFQTQDQDQERNQEQDQERAAPLTSDETEKKEEKETDSGLIPVPKEMYFETKIWADSILAEKDPTMNSCFAVREITFAHYVPPTNQRVKKNKKYQGEEMSAALEETRHKSSMKASVGKEALIRVKWALQRHVQRLARTLWRDRSPSLIEEEYLLTLIRNNASPSSSLIQKLGRLQQQASLCGIDKSQNNDSERCESDKIRKPSKSSEEPWYGLEARLSNFGLISCFNVENSHFSRPSTDPLTDLGFSGNTSGPAELLDPTYEYAIRWQDDLCLAILFRFLKSGTSALSSVEFSAVDICGSRLVNEHLRSMLISSLQQTSLSSSTSSDICAISLPITPIHVQKDDIGDEDNQPKQCKEHKEHKTPMIQHLSIIKALLNTNGLTVDMFPSFVDAKSFALDIVRGINQVSQPPSFDPTFVQSTSPHVDVLFEKISYICSLGQKLLAIVYASLPQTTFVMRVDIAPEFKQISRKTVATPIVVSLVSIYSPSRDYKDYFMKTQNETSTPEEKTVFFHITSHALEPISACQSATIISTLRLKEDVLNKDCLSTDYGLLSLPRDFYVESSVAKATNEVKNYLARLDFRKKQNENSVDVDDISQPSTPPGSSEAASLVSFRAQYNTSITLQRAFESVANSSTWACSSIGRCFDIIAVSSPLNAICASMVMILTADGTVWLYDTPI